MAKPSFSIASVAEFQVSHHIQRLLQFKSIPIRRLYLASKISLSNSIQQQPQYYISWSLIKFVILILHLHRRIKFALDNERDTEKVEQKVKHASYKAWHEEITTSTSRLAHNGSANFTRCNDGTGTPSGMKEVRLQKKKNFTNWWTQDNLKSYQWLNAKVFPRYLGPLKEGHWCRHFLQPACHKVAPSELQTCIWRRRSLGWRRSW